MSYLYRTRPSPFELGLRRPRCILCLCTRYMSLHFAWCNFILHASPLTCFRLIFSHMSCMNDILGDLFFHLHFGHWSSTMLFHSQFRRAACGKFQTRRRNTSPFPLLLPCQSHFRKSPFAGNPANMHTQLDKIFRRTNLRTTIPVQQSCLRHHALPHNSKLECVIPFSQMPALRLWSDSNKCLR